MKQNKKTNFTRHFFIDLAKECGLNATIFEQLGSRRDTEIVVDNDTLEMLVKLQEQFARLEEMGDDEYRGFYIELPRPTPEEWGDCEASIVDGEYESKEEYLWDWELSNPGMVSCRLRQIQRKAYHTIHGQETLVFYYCELFSIYKPSR